MLKPNLCHSFAAHLRTNAKVLTTARKNLQYLLPPWAWASPWPQLPVISLFIHTTSQTWRLPTFIHSLIMVSPHWPLGFAPQTRRWAGWSSCSSLYSLMAHPLASAELCSNLPFSDRPSPANLFRLYPTPTNPNPSVLHFPTIVSASHITPTYYYFIHCLSSFCKMNAPQNQGFFIFFISCRILASTRWLCTYWLVNNYLLNEWKKRYSLTGYLNPVNQQK